MWLPTVGSSVPTVGSRVPPRGIKGAHRGIKGARRGIKGARRGIKGAHRWIKGAQLAPIAGTVPGLCLGCAWLCQQAWVSVSGSDIQIPKTNKNQHKTHFRANRAAVADRPAYQLGAGGRASCGCLP